LSKKKWLLYSLVAIPVTVLGLLAVGIVVVSTSAFRDFLRSEIRKQALARTGANVEIGSLDFHWTRLALDLTNVVVRGTEKQTDQPPLAQAKTLEIAVEFLPLLRGKLHLRTFALDQPVVRLRIDAQGHSNLPVAPQPSTSTGPSEVFDLEIRNCEIRSGVIYYNDLQIPLDAELHDLTFNAGYKLLRAEYSGSLSYDEGRLSAPQLAPISHALRMHFTATREQLSIDQFALTTGKSFISVVGHLKNYSEPTIDGAYEGQIFTTEFAQALRTQSMPAGTVALNGKFGYQPQPTRAFIAALTLDGSARSERLSVRTGQRPLEITWASANYELRNANLEIKNLSANALGGSAKANLEMLRVDASPVSRVDASVRGISLATASDALAPKGAREVPVTGNINMNVRASWAASLSKLMAHVRLVIESPAQTKPSRSTIPLNGLVQADYDGPRNTVSFNQSYLQTASTKLTVGGTLSPRRGTNSDITLSMTTSDLKELTSLVTVVQNAIQPGRAGAPIPEISGAANFNARITGTAKNPQIQGQLSAQNVSIDRSRLRSISMRIGADPSKVSIQQGEIVALPQGDIAFSGSAGLKRWSLVESGAIALKATVRNMSVTDAMEIARLNYPVTGTISAQVTVGGTRAAPQGTANVTVIHGSAWNEAVNNLGVKATFHQGIIDSTASVQVPAGTITADATYRIAARQYQAKVQGNGIELEKISAIQRGAAIRGALNVTASGSGTIQNPQLQSDLEIANFQVEDQAVSNFDADLAVANQQATVMMRGTTDKGSFQAKAGVALTGDRYATVSVDAREIPLQAVAERFLPAESSKIQGETEIHLSAKGPLTAPAQIEAHIQIPMLNVSVADAEMKLAHPLLADYRQGTLTVAPTQLEGTGTNLTFGGTFPIRSKSTVAISANGTVDLAVLQKFAPSVHSSGQLEIRVDSHGTLLRSGMHGEVQIKNAVFSTDTIPVGIEGLNAQINISGDRADIATLAGAAGGGAVSMTGFVTYGNEPAFSLGLNAQSVRIRYPQGLRSVLSGRINMQGNTSAANITGRVLINRLSFTQAFDLANLSNYFSDNGVASAPSAFENNTKLNVTVQSSQDLSLANSKVSLGGSANLNVTGTLANPVVLGRIALTSGDVFFLGKRFQVQSGTIEFANPVRTEPVVRMAVTTTVEQYNVTLNLSGPVDRLRTSYTSDPALPPADIIHLLAFGNTEEEANASASTSAATSAESVLAGQVSGQVAGKIEDLTGISQLSVDPLAVNSQGNPGAQVAIQERVTGSILFTYSTDVTQTQSQTAEVQYQINKQASVTALRDQYGGYVAVFRYRKVF